MGNLCQLGNGHIFLQMRMDIAHHTPHRILSAAPLATCQPQESTHNLQDLCLLQQQIRQRIRPAVSRLERPIHSPWLVHCHICR